MRRLIFSLISLVSLATRQNAYKLQMIKQSLTGWFEPRQVVVYIHNQGELKIIITKSLLKIPKKQQLCVQKQSSWFAWWWQYHGYWDVFKQDIQENWSILRKNWLNSNYLWGTQAFRIQSCLNAPIKLDKSADLIPTRLKALNICFCERCWRFCTFLSSLTR